MARACDEAGIALRAFSGITVVPPGELIPAGGDHYRVFTPYWRAWRAATAKEQGVPPYVVFHDTTLRKRQDWTKHFFVSADDEVVVDADLAEFVDDDGEAATFRVFEQIAEPLAEPAGIALASAAGPAFGAVAVLAVVLSIGGYAFTASNTVPMLPRPISHCSSWVGGPMCWSAIAACAASSSFTLR